jgi:hypothetical protein
MGKVKIHALYDDEEILLKAVKEVRSKGIKVKEVFTPFPVHGLDTAMGLKRTRMAICAFIYGITGLLLGWLMMGYMMIVDWPQSYGGKPNFSTHEDWNLLFQQIEAFIRNLPAFIPVSFECTVFCAAHGMALTFFLRSWILPGVTEKNPDPRTTDDMFLMEVEVSADKATTATTTLNQTGAIEVKNLSPCLPAGRQPSPLERE